MIGLLLFALATRAEEPVESLWVALPGPRERARAQAAGFGWAEGQDGDWYLLDGTAAMAEAAGLTWRRASMFPPTWAPTAADVATRLRALPSGTLVQIGESALGEPILAVRFGRGGRALRVLGGHHGDEGSSVEVAVRVAEAVAAGAVTLPPDTELWVAPVVNPDGLDAATRANARAVDLNRNYAHEWDAAVVGAGTAPFSEPETRAVRALARARTFDAGLSLHAGAQNIGWVWNYTAETRPAEESLLADLADTYAAACEAPGFWTTNGADWYETRGDTTDWTYGAWGAYDFTLELTAQKSPPVEEVDTYVAWHLDAVLAWVATPADIAARVVDDATGEPLPATVSGPGVAALHTGPDGRVARWVDPAEPGGWTVSAPGYAPAPLADETRLVATGLLAALPEPRLLSRGAGPTVVTLAGAGAGALTLVQPGEADITVLADAPGAWTLDPSTLAPGAWTLVTDAGVAPRALFVGEVDDRVALTDVALSDGILTVRGTGFGAGAEAWSIGGAARAWRPLPRLSETDSTLVFTLDADHDDVIVWTNGAWLAALDVRGEPAVDSTPPPEEVVEPPLVDELDPTLYALGRCSAAPGGSGALALLGALAAVGARRRAG